MPREYTQKRKEYERRGIDSDDAKRQASIWFWNEFGISVREAHKLTEQGKWGKWKKDHGFSTKVKEDTGDREVRTGIRRLRSPFVGQGKLKEPEHLLLFGDRKLIEHVSKMTGIKIIDWEPFKDGVGAEFVVYTSEDRDSIIKTARELGVGVAEEEFSTIVKPRVRTIAKGQRKRGKGWKNESQRHMMSSKGVKTKRR